MRSLMSEAMEWFYGLWRAAWERWAGAREFYGENVPEGWEK